MLLSILFILLRLEERLLLPLAMEVLLFQDSSNKNSTVEREATAVWDYDVAGKIEAAKRLPVLVSPQAVACQTHSHHSLSRNQDKYYQ
jgi:hypothetical protein